MNSNVAGLFIEAGIITATGVAITTWLVTRYARAQSRLTRARQRETDMRAGDWRHSYAQLRDACDAVIVELDTSPATYDLFPGHIRELLDAAHDRARELEAREGLSHR